MQIRPWHRPASAYAAGLIFGMGLCVSQMVNPARVLAFLDVFGPWDPHLAFVMVGAVVTSAIGFRLVFSRGKPLMTDRFALPKGVKIDKSLITGAVIFGTGWGLAGFCPGPAVTALGALSPQALVFLAAMVIGLGIGKALQPSGLRRPSRPRRPAPQQTEAPANQQVST